MKTLHKSNFVEILFDEEKSLIVDKFLPTSSEMDTEDFKQEMYIFVEMCEKYLPKRELVYLIDMGYPIVPEVQEWMNTEIFPRYLNIIKRMAFLMPKEFILGVAVEQTMEEEVGQKFIQAYFDDEEKALVWLMQ